MKQVIILSRVSTEGQTLESQTDRVKQEVLKHYREEQIIVIENKESAVKKSEEELLGINEMKSYIDTGNIEAVYAYELSRLSRRPAVLYNLRDYFLNHKVQLIVLTPYFRLLDDDGKLNESSNVIFALYASFSEQEARNLKYRCVRGKIKRSKEGYFVGGKDLFGYSHDDNKKYIVNEEEAKIVREIYSMFIGGMSKLSIAREMRNRGYFLNFQSAVDCHTHINNILRNRDYCGENNKPRIISDSLYEAAQNKFPSKKKREKTERLALGRSFLFNPYCQTKRKLFYVNTRNNDYFSYTTDKETRIFIKINIVDTLIWHVLKKHYPRFISAFTALYIDSNSKNKNSIRERIKTLTEEIYGLNESIQKIEERIIYGKLTQERGEQLEKSIDKQIDLKKEQINELTKSLEEIPALDVNSDLDILTDDEKYKLVKAVFFQIHLWREKRYHWFIDFWLDGDTIEHYKIYSRIPYYYLIENDELIKLENILEIK